MPVTRPTVAVHVIGEPVDKSIAQVVERVADVQFSGDVKCVVEERRRTPPQLASSQNRPRRRGGRILVQERVDRGGGLVNALGRGNDRSAINQWPVRYGYNSWYSDGRRP